MKKIAVDMMGSDLGPEELKKGLLRFAEEYPDYSFILFGEKSKLLSFTVVML